MAQTPKTPRVTKKRGPSYPVWSKVFLKELAATSNVTASIKKAKTCPSTVYDARRNRPEFNRKWQIALVEGYDNLELELLSRMRQGEFKTPVGQKRTFDNAVALRLLAAHRASAARQRAIHDNEDSDAIIASINAKLDLMRERAIAAGEYSEDGEASDDGE